MNRMRSFSVFKELSTAACHLLAAIVKASSFLFYLKLHVPNHRQFQIVDYFVCQAPSFRRYCLRIQVSRHLYRRLVYLQHVYALDC